MSSPPNGGPLPHHQQLRR